MDILSRPHFFSFSLHTVEYPKSVSECVSRMWYVKMMRLREMRTGSWTMSNRHEPTSPN